MKGLSERSTDERDLHMLHMIQRGVDRKVISELTGMQMPYIGAVLSRVSKADMAESGEVADVVRLAYLPPAKKTPQKLQERKAILFHRREELIAQIAGEQIRHRATSSLIAELVSVNTKILAIG